MNEKRVSLAIVVFLAFTVVFSGTVMAGKKNQSGTTPSLNQAEIEALVYMREEEKLAKDVYRYLYDVWGQRIFENIAASEQKHMDAVLYLLGKYGLEDPALRPGEFDDQRLQDLYDELVAKGKISLIDALEVGVIIEETDISDLEECLSITNKQDIRQVFTNLLNGSENHLAAFNSQLGY